MPVVNPGEVWIIDFGMTAQGRPALLLTGTPADDELDLVTALLHTTALRGNRWELSVPKPFLKPGALPHPTGANHFDRQAGAKTRHPDGGRNEARSGCAGQAPGSLNRLDQSVSVDVPRPGASSDGRGHAPNQDRRGVYRNTPIRRLVSCHLHLPAKTMRPPPGTDSSPGSLHGTR
jgi:hypothetical protein